jgi:RNA polymerase sigma-70 factor (ECF subfamily)
MPATSEHAEIPPTPTPAMDAPREVRQAADRWLTDHGDVLWRFCRARVRREDIAEEIVQDTLLAAMEGFHGFEGRSTERTWLLGIAARKVADHFRREARARARGDRSSAPPPGRRISDGISTEFKDDGCWARVGPRWGEPAPDSEEHRAQVDALRRCVGKLPPTLAEVVWMRDILNIPSHEVCKALGLTPTNLWTRTHRARMALRACIEALTGTGKST